MASKQNVPVMDNHMSKRSDVPPDGRPRLKRQPTLQTSTVDVETRDTKIGKGLMRMLTEEFKKASRCSR